MCIFQLIEAVICGLTFNLAEIDTWTVLDRVMTGKRLLKYILDIVMKCSNRMISKNFVKSIRLFIEFEVFPRIIILILNTNSTKLI